MTGTLPRIIAFYLPQFHPIDENSRWWGPGFTEWHNVARARPLFRGHRQPRLPGELGFYDLRLRQTRLEQAALARQYGVHGFCYWHYWFGGKRLLETPVEEVLASKEPDFPFCLGWANESWTGVWHGSPKTVLMEQTYPGEDPERHYEVLRNYFLDPRYIRLQGKPLLYIYQPRRLPARMGYLSRLRQLARSDGFPDLYILGTWLPNPSGRFDDVSDLDIDGAVITNLTGRDAAGRDQWLYAAKCKLLAIVGQPGGPRRVKYSSAIDSMVPDLRRFAFPAYNCVISNWDNTPRSGKRGLVLTGSSPQLFRGALRKAFSNLLTRPQTDCGGEYVFLKSWNEWAEGNYVEPDIEHGRQYLEAISATLAEFSESEGPLRTCE